MNLVFDLYLLLDLRKIMAENRPPSVIFSDLCRRCQREFGIHDIDVQNLARMSNNQSDLSLHQIDDDWSLIGETQLRNNQVTVNVLFKIPNWIVDRAGSNDVFAVMGQFLSEFGVDVRIGQDHGRLIRNVIIRSQPGQDLQQLLSGAFPRSGEFIPLLNATQVQNSRGEQALRINFAFCVDVGRYRGIIP